MEESAVESMAEKASEVTAASASEGDLTVKVPEDDNANTSPSVRKSQRNSFGPSSSLLTRSRVSPTSGQKTKGSNGVVSPINNISQKRPQDEEFAENNAEQENEINRHAPPVKRRKVDKLGEKLDAVCDPYCWVCHKENTSLDCAVCPRSYHTRCAGQMPSQDPACWMCPECQCIMVAEDIDTQSPAMSVLSVDQLVTLFKFSLQRLKTYALEVFQKPVCSEQVPTYFDYIVHPMDLQTLEKNIKLKMYGCTESLLADAKWIYHNSLIFNGNAHKLTASAKSLLMACKQEMREIEVCPDCYLHAHTVKENWFVEPCRRPHVLVWAKLKGFPFWPGKAMRVVNGNVDIRFFGAHDRAWVPLNLCYQLSSEMPAPLKTKKKTSFENSLDELEQHISKLRLKLGGFEYAPIRTPFDPEKLYLSPISKVTTGRRHSDAEQVSPVKGRTVTIVTSSWMRKLQAEGGTLAGLGATGSNSKPSPTKKKKAHKQHKGGTPKKDSHKKASTEPASATPLVVSKPVISAELSIKTVDSNKNPPLGVFEISNDMDIPKELNIQTETLGLNDFSATHLERFKIIESTIERIKESFNDDDDEDEQCQTKDQQTDVMENDRMDTDDNSMNLVKESNTRTVSRSASSGEDDIPLIQLQKSVLTRELDSGSPECEVSSTTNNEQVTKEFSVPKKGSAFVMKLHQTILSCKANLGLNNVDRSEGSSSSDSEQDSGSSNEESEKDSSNHSDGDIGDKSDAVNDAEDKDRSAEEVEESNGESCSMDTSLSKIVEENSVNASASVSEREEDCANSLPQSDQIESESESDVEVISVNNKISVENLVEKSDSVDSSGKGTSDRSNDSTALKAVSNSETRPVAASVQEKQLTNSDSCAIRSPPDITKYAYKVIEIMTDLCKNVGTSESHVKGLELEIGRINWLHEQEIKEIKHNTDLVLLEVRQSMEADKNKALAELKQKFEAEKKALLAEKEKALTETKRKQWCANCSKEAIYYCCWNTSYCDYKCQQEHWPSHVTSCAQTQRATVISDSQNDNMRPGSNVVITQIQPNAGRPRVFPPTSGAAVGNNTVSVHYVSSLPSNISNYQLIPQSIPLPRISVPRLSQPPSAPPAVQPQIMRPPTAVVVSRPAVVQAPTGSVRFAPRPPT